MHKRFFLLDLVSTCFRFFSPEKRKTGECSCAYNCVCVDVFSRTRSEARCTVHLHILWVRVDRLRTRYPNIVRRTRNSRRAREVRYSPVRLSSHIFSPQSWNHFDVIHQQPMVYHWLWECLSEVCHSPYLEFENDTWRRRRTSRPRIDNISSHYPRYDIHVLYIQYMCVYVYVEREGEK